MMEVQFPNTGTLLNPLNLVRLGKSKGKQMSGLSVVIPSFNSAPWLESTLGSLETALTRSSWDAEIIVVDDGSTDNSRQVLEKFNSQTDFEFTIISQQNQGRFLARWSGIQLASKKQILLLDSRVLIDEDSLGYVESEMHQFDGDAIWNAYVRTDYRSSLPGLFWDVPTRLFWGNFLKNPRRVQFGEADFDKNPKGTGCLLLNRELLVDSYKEVWPEGDLALVSDDTRLLRNLVQKQDIVLDPGFSALYLPRISMKSFVAHTFMRGTLFVDSYAGTSSIRKLIIVFAALLPLLFIAIASSGFFLLPLAALAVLIFIPAVIGALRKAHLKALASYLLLVLPFGILFWAGLIRGIFVHRRYFGLKKRSTK